MLLVAPYSAQDQPKELQNDKKGDIVKNDDIDVSFEDNSNDDIDIAQYQFSTFWICFEYTLVFVLRL